MTHQRIHQRITDHRAVGPLARRLRALGGDTAGVAGIEFAIVAPLLLGLLMAGITLFDMFRFEERTESTTYTIADLASRQDLVDRGTLDDLHATHVALVGPRADETTTRISSVVHKVTKRNKDGEVTESKLVPEWTYENGADNDCKPANDLPMGLIPEIAVNDSVIIVETASEKRLLTRRITGLVKTTFTDTAVVRPRYVDSVALRAC